MSRLLFFVAFLFARHALRDFRRIWHLYTADRAPIWPQPDDYVPTYLTEMYR